MEGLNKMSKVQLNRIRAKTGNFEKSLLNVSINQLKYEFAKEMNKMIFSKHIQALSPKLLGKQILQSPFKLEPKVVKKYGKMFAYKKKEFQRNLRE